ncbi:MAG: hypothetical protein RBG1_1C00001G1437 [candidate division Zixibacteria bacterium RBG-1]|nr:MAG: hypothetical protein RBG1_1C00001G1437 [candidate division Zixibacteria bacterium RBG-1]
MKNMTYTEVMAELKKLGTAQNVKIYKRHGAGDNLFGVSFANLNKLQKKIKVDHRLAVQLWESGNTDARILATMIADPKQITSAQADKWIENLTSYGLVDLFAGLVSRAAFAKEKMEEWMKSSKEFVRQCGYSILGGLLKNGAGISETDCQRYLKTIEKEIHSSPNRARHSMNGAVIGIGVFKPALIAEAFATAKKIGKVEVDHGETGCKTPDATDYIQKVLKRVKR